MISYEEDFDFPFPTRSSMRVNWTLPRQSSNRHRQQKRNSSEANNKHGSHGHVAVVEPERVTNRTDDIDGATAATTEAYQIRKRFQHKPDLFSVSDIQGSQCQRLIPLDVRKPNDRHISNQDIEHSVPASGTKKFATRRTVNPLAPNYHLPRANRYRGGEDKTFFRAPTPPKQRRLGGTSSGGTSAESVGSNGSSLPVLYRDTLRIDDIDGTVANHSRMLGSLPNVIRHKKLVQERQNQEAGGGSKQPAAVGLDTVGSIIFGHTPILPGQLRRS